MINTMLLWIVSIEHIHMLVYILFLIMILTSEKSSESMIAWIFTITVFPVGGFILYLLFGINWRKNKLVNIKDKLQNKKSKVRNFVKYDPAQFFSLENNIDENYEKSNMSGEEKEIYKMLNQTEKTYLTKKKL